MLCIAKLQSVFLSISLDLKTLQSGTSTVLKANSKSRLWVA